MSKKVFMCLDMCLNIASLDNVLVCLDIPRKCFNLYAPFYAV